MLQVSYEDGEEEQLWLAAERVRLLTHPGEAFCLPPSIHHLRKLAQKLLQGAEAESGKLASSHLLAIEHPPDAGNKLCLVMRLWHSLSKPWTAMACFCMIRHLCHLSNQPCLSALGHGLRQLHDKRGGMHKVHPASTPRTTPGR